MIQVFINLPINLTFRAFPNNSLLFTITWSYFYRYFTKIFCKQPMIIRAKKIGLPDDLSFTQFIHGRSRNFFNYPIGIFNALIAETPNRLRRLRYPPGSLLRGIIYIIGKL